MREAFLTLPRRTAITRRGGSQRDLRAHELAALVLGAHRDALGQGPPVDRVVLACVATPGNVARNAALAAGLPPETPAVTINEQCSGGLAAIRIAVEAVQAGAADLVIAGGVESASRAQVALDRGDTSHPRVSHAPPPFADPDMGPGADATAAMLGVDRAAQDRYAAASYARTAAAATAGVFEPLLVPGGGHDDLPHRTPQLERLLRYPPAFGPDGTVTAGNAAGHADGAAAVVVASAEALASAGVDPLARVRATATAAGDPAYPALAVVPAIRAALARAGLGAGAIERWEINEAFAVKVVACIEAFDLDPARVNPWGGALSYGHPFSASGAILVAHLLAALSGGEVALGMAAVAGAGGMGEALCLGV